MVRKKEDRSHIAGSVPDNIADYYAVLCLKRVDNGGWTPVEYPFPTREDAEVYADTLREGQQGAVAVRPRMWV